MHAADRALPGGYAARKMAIGVLPRIAWNENARLLMLTLAGGGKEI
jgi:hypothetical protein